MLDIGKEDSKLVADTLWLEYYVTGNNHSLNKALVAEHNYHFLFNSKKIKVDALIDTRTKTEKQDDLKTLGTQITIELVKKYEDEGNMKYANHYRNLLNKAKK